MKKLYLFLIVLLSGVAAIAQPPGLPEQECIYGISVCQSGYTQNNSYVGYGATQELNTTNQGCLGSAEKNDVWYIITVSTSGIMNLTITPNDLTDDYDFAVWDITNGGCQDIYNGAGPIGSPAPAPTSACNFSGARGITGLNTANVPTGSQWSNSLNVTAGQVLALNVSNFSSTQSGYTLDFNGSTAQIFDNVPPYFKNTFNRCGFVADSIDILLSERVLCTSIASDGSNFTLSPLPPGITILSAQGLNCGAAGMTQTIRLKFSGTLPAGTYTLSPAQGTNGSFLVDACGNAQTQTGQGSTLTFTMVPPTPPEIQSHADPACNHILVTFDRNIKCQTVAPNGSDFTLTGPDGSVQIVRADNSTCDTNGLGKTIDLHFNKSIAVPGTYTIGFKTGTDGNGITDTCNLVSYKTYSFVVSDGGVTATATPALLCAPGYTQLAAATAVQPYGSAVRCGTQGGPDNDSTISKTVVVGAGTDVTNGTTAYTPFRSGAQNARTQMLYTAADLQAAGFTAGRIKNLAFFVTTKTSTAPYSNLSVKMGCTPNANLAGGYVYGLPTVYSSAAYNTVVGYNNIALTNAYDWDGVSNLIVEICYSNATTTGSFDQLRGVAGRTASVYQRSGSNTVSGCTYTSTTGTGGTSDMLPDIRLTMITPAVSSYQWLWTPSQYVQDSTAQNTAVFVPTPGTYNVRLKDANGCYRRDAASVDISVRNPYGHPNNDTAICTGGAAHLLVGNGVSYNWFPADGLSCTSCPDPYASPTQTTTYYAAIFDANGCSDTLKATVIVNPLPVVKASPDVTILSGSVTPLYVLAPAGAGYTWTPTEGLDNPVIANPKASPLQNTTYVVRVTDTNYCIAYDTVNVRVNRNGTFENDRTTALIPTAFSPNGDGRNDYFKVENLGVNKLVEMRIFNRWGNMVFNRADNTGWDGTYNGTDQPTGVYTYLIRIAKPDGTLQTYKGDLTVVR